MSFFRKFKKIAGFCVLTLSLAVLAMTFGAAASLAAEQAADDSAPAARAGSGGPYSGNVYKETPPGPKSEAYGDAKYGPDHLRRISNTEHLPAAPQVEKTLPESAIR